MAKDKKSAVIYSDWITTFEELEDCEAGQLIKHLFRYINDQNPEPPSRLIKLIFEPLKQSLKRDLKKYEDKRLKNIDNANKRWHNNDANACDGIKDDAKHAVSVSVNDSVNDSVNVLKKKRIAAISSTADRQKVFYNSLIPFLQEHPKERIKQFYEYWSELNKSQTKMRFEMEKTWEIPKRLTTWKNKENDFKKPFEKSVPKPKINTPAEWMD